MSEGSKKAQKQGFHTKRVALVLMAVLGVVILLLLAAVYKERSRLPDTGSRNVLVGIDDGGTVEFIPEFSDKSGKNDTDDNANGGSGPENTGPASENEVPAHYELDAECILQLPELPGGCEAVALTIVLNYMGFTVDKRQIVDEYLPMGEIGKTDPSEAFVGNPYERDGYYGCYAPAIVTAANRYFEDNDYSYIAVDISGTDMKTITEEYVYRYGRPAIVWASKDLKEIYPSTTWYVRGREIRWRRNNHCMALTGWKQDDYIVADPLSGIKEYPKDLFDIRYEQNHMNAVFIFSQQEYEEYEKYNSKPH